jgi:DNA-binding IclR family transcriptional regulator
MSIKMRKNKITARSSERTRDKLSPQAALATRPMAAPSRATSREVEKSSPTEKVFTLLEIMAREGRPMGLLDLSQAMRAPKTTINRVTMQLERLGYIQREPGSRHLVVSPALVSFAVDVLSSSVRQAERRAMLVELMERIGESCNIGIRVGNEIVYLDDAISNGPFALRFRRGLRAPLYCTSQGKLYLARMTQAEWRHFLSVTKFERFTEHTITDPKELRKAIDEVRETGFAWSSEEFVQGVAGAAVPITGDNNRMYASLSFAAPASRMSPNFLRKVRPILDEVARRLAQTYTL